MFWKKTNKKFALLEKWIIDKQRLINENAEEIADIKKELEEIKSELTKKNIEEKIVVLKEELRKKVDISFVSETQTELKKILVLEDKIELLSRLASIPNKTENKDYKLERKKRFIIQLPELKKKWAETERRQIMEIEKNRQSSKDLFNKRNELYQKYLVADKSKQKDLAIKFKTQYETLDWVMGETEGLK